MNGHLAKEVSPRKIRQERVLTAYKITKSRRERSVRCMMDRAHGSHGMTASGLTKKVIE
ncbi:hypothetical protein [Niabella aurantiaca]|uniref:hypothetical protein n=1 Tax=Niabella aurantiaca TaxID=379900 RepID=UPI00035C4C78|nr:hypothetical protein [Niabella aurantiaca]